MQADKAVHPEMKKPARGGLTLTGLVTSGLPLGYLRSHRLWQPPCPGRQVGVSVWLISKCVFIVTQIVCPLLAQMLLNVCSYPFAFH